MMFDHFFSFFYMFCLAVSIVTVWRWWRRNIFWLLTNVFFSWQSLDTTVSWRELAWREMTKWVTCLIWRQSGADSRCLRCRGEKKWKGHQVYAMEHQHAVSGDIFTVKRWHFTMFCAMEGHPGGHFILLYQPRGIQERQSPSGPPVNSITCGLESKALPDWFVRLFCYFCFLHIIWLV